ncbi:MAG: alpha/beta fold hydrolase [Gammaproteobacteria bacterium]
MATVRQCLLAAVLLCFVPPMHALELEPCVLSAAGGRIEVAASCGMLSVPLNPDAPAGEKIELFVARVAALSDNPSPDPLTVITGGPGQASTTWYAQVGSAFSRIRRTRDIFVVDQRGTGKSAGLFCANIEGDDALAYDPETIGRLGIECLDTLEHDPRYFTTSVAVRDLDLVREALGYASQNIYAVSYGTRVAQHYLRRYPERSMRRKTRDSSPRSSSSR